MGWVPAVRYLDICKSNIGAAVSVVHENIVEFDVCGAKVLLLSVRLKDLDILYDTLIQQVQFIPVCTYPSACKTWSVSSTLFAAYLISRRLSFFRLEARSKLLSRCLRTMDGGSRSRGSCISSINGRRYGACRWKRLIISRSFSSRVFGADLMTTGWSRPSLSRSVISPYAQEQKPSEGIPSHTVQARRRYETAWWWCIC